MKKLNDILVQQPEPRFRELSKICLSIFRVWDRKEARGIIIPDCLYLNWAEYAPHKGWFGVVGYYRDDLEEKDFHLIKNKVFKVWL